MSTEVKAQMEEKLKLQKHGGNDNGDLALENGGLGSSDAHDQLVQMVMELKLQNEFLKSQFEGFQNFQQTEPSETEGGKSEEVEQLHQMIESLNVHLLEEKQKRVAAEVALKHLQKAHSKADSKAQELSAKLAEAQQKLDQEIKEREKKYSDLDLKFTRLHKRAKQRIQDVQKMYSFFM